MYFWLVHGDWTAFCNEPVDAVQDIHLLITRIYRRVPILMARTDGIVELFACSSGIISSGSS